MAKIEFDFIRTAGYLAALALVLCPLVGGDLDVYYRVMGMTYFYATLAFAWNLFALTGTISLGHAAFFGLGAYGSALADHYWHVSPFLTLFIGGITGSAYGLLWCASLLRLRGARFALATLASVEIPRAIVDNWDSFTFGSMGLVGIKGLPALAFFRSQVDLGENLRAQYYLLLVLALLAGLVHRIAISSRWGWKVRSVREDEVAASALGINVQGTRVRALLMSAFLTGVCGGLYAHLLGLVEPPLVFSLHISALPLVLSVFGGRYQLWGPFLGALAIYPVDQLLFHSLLPVGHAAVYGITLIVVLLFFPHGIGSWIQRPTNRAWN